MSTQLPTHNSLAPAEENHSPSDWANKVKLAAGYLLLLGPFIRRMVLGPNDSAPGAPTNLSRTSRRELALSFLAKTSDLETRRQLKAIIATDTLADPWASAVRCVDMR